MRKLPAIKHYLSVLVLATFLPTAGLALALFHTSVEREYEVTWQRAGARATFTIAAVDAQLDALSGTLDTLAVSPSLTAGDLEEFLSLARSVTGSRVDAVSLMRPDGVTVLNSRVTPGRPVPAFSVPVEAVGRALLERRTVITDIFLGAVSRTPIFAMMKPVQVDGAPMVLAVGLFAERFSALVNRTQPPWETAIIDSSGVDVARYPAEGGHMPAYRKDLLNQVLADNQGRLRMAGEQGGELLLVFERSPTWGWAAVASLPASEAEAPAARQARIYIGGALALVLPSFLLAGWLGLRLAHHMGALARHATALRSGAAGAAATPATPPCRELADVAQLLTEAGAEIAARDAQLRQQRDLAEARAEQINAQTEVLARSNAELEQFAYVASHDLREPLRMINSFLTLLERRLGAGLDSESREFLDFARDGAQRMDRMILDLLEYSRIGRISPPTEDVDVGEALEQARAALGASIAETGAEILVETALPTVAAPRQEVVRLLQNLVGNAIKYHSPERPPVVRVSAAPEPDSGPGGRWRLSIADNGIGIDPQYFERIFQLFQRLHDRTHYEGNGIGLAICRKTAERLGGRIWVDSEPGRGSTFHVTLPATAP